MHYRIEEVSTDRASGHCYVRVSFWTRSADRNRGDPPVIVNDFLMQLRPTGERVITDAEGRFLRADGVFVAPEDVTAEDNAIGWQRESFTRDVPAEIIANIEAYVERAEGRGDAGDRTATRERDESDPHRILERDDVRALRNTTRDTPRRR